MAQKISQKVSRKGRPPVAQHQVFAALHKRIITGDLEPADRLPTRRELGETFNVGLPAVQRALEFLIKDGFVVSRGTHGTFVSDNPPHISRYGLVFEDGISNNPDYPTPHFWPILSRSATRISQRLGKPIEIYNGITGDKNAATLAKLLKDVKLHRLAGLIVSNPLSHLNHYSVYQNSGMPTVTMAISKMDFPFHRIHMDYFSLFDRALNYLREKGCKRIALLRNTRICGEVESAIHQAIKKNNVIIPTYWDQKITAGSADTATNLMHLLFSEIQTIQPDGLFVADDSFFPHVVKGLKGLNVKVGFEPDDVKIVAHCNFPIAEKQLFEIKRIGFDTELMILKAMELIDQSRRGLQGYQLKVLSAVFEHEYMNSLVV